MCLDQGFDGGTGERRKWKTKSLALNAEPGATSGARSENKFILVYWVISANIARFFALK